MAKFTNPLDGIKVASPCSANWDEMYGSNQQRFCGECKLNVYNLSEMTKQEAENLIMNAEGRLCAKFYRRADGTVITKDCPVGYAAFKKKMSKMWTAVATVVLTALSGIGITAFLNRQTVDYVEMGSMEIQKPESIRVTPVEPPEMIMGDIAMPDPKPEPIMGRISSDKN